MSKFTQKHAQIAFCSALKQQKCHKIKKSVAQKSAKNKSKNKQLSNKTSQNTSHS